MPPSPKPPAPGARITVRGEDFLVLETQAVADGNYVISTTGISELVQGQAFDFDTALDDFEVLAPEHTRLVPDTEPGYRKTKLYLETQLRNAFTTSDKIAIADRAAFDVATYQLEPTRKALQLPRARLLIADDVGLGKTVEVGILLTELIERGRGKRILVLALKSILAQFQQEIWNRFAIPLVRLDSVGIARIKAELPADKNPFNYYDKTIISIDTLKNNAKFKHYIERTEWDVIVIDECHTVANVGSQRGALAQMLATRCESLILTSATPHNGKRENFANLIRMLEPTAVPRSLEFDKDDISRYFVRRFKKDIVEDNIRSNFRDRQLLPIHTDLRPAEEDFLRWQQQLKAAERAAGLRTHQFVSILLFKAYLSSPSAARESLQNRLAKRRQALDQCEDPTEVEQLTHEIANLREGKQLLDQVLATDADSKLHALLDLFTELNWRGRPRDERIVIFAERIATLGYLQKELVRRLDIKAEAVQVFDGSLSDVEQQQIIEDFGTEHSKVRLFLTSDAGAQGVNLHYFCHRMVNYDLPWSLITLNQRNGRIDRYGQTQTPVIHCLLARSEQNGLKTDLHIIDLILKKEEEVKQTLGDAGFVLQLFDANREEAHTADALVAQDLEFLAEPAADPAVDEAAALEALFAAVNAAETGQRPATGEDHFLKPVSFYPDDFSYFRELLRYLEQLNAIRAGSIDYSSANLVEVEYDRELAAVLHDVPAEAKPKQGDLFRLTTDAEKVMKAIADARADQDQWARFQMLYDPHPLAAYWMTKLEARMEKGVAPVARLRQLQTGQRSYVFHGQVTNQLGQNVISDFFVISLDADGRVFRKPESLYDFMQEFGLQEEVYTATTSEAELAELTGHLSLAIGYAQEMHMQVRQDELATRMQRQQREYEQQLQAWYRQSSNELDLRYEAPTGFQRKNLERGHAELQSILDERSQFVRNLTQLGESPYLRLLAVFYN